MDHASLLTSQSYMSHSHIHTLMTCMTNTFTYIHTPLGAILGLSIFSMQNQASDLGHSQLLQMVHSLTQISLIETIVMIPKL